MSESRRRFLQRSIAGAAGFLTWPALGEVAGGEAGPPPLPPMEDRRAQAPAPPVAVCRAHDFDLEGLARCLRDLFDRIGGLRKLVSGKTVTVKLNTTGNGRVPLRGLPAGRTYQTHPAMVEVLCGLLRESGARRLYLVESFYERRPPEEILARQGWDVERIRAAAGHTAVFEDTRNRGAHKDYVKLAVPWGGYTFPAYHLNRRYLDTDVLVSLAKMKDHVTAGVTGAVKNLFGIAPTSLYGDDAPNEDSISNRGAVFHSGSRPVPAGVTAERDPGRPRLGRPRESYYRVPMVTADLCGVRPVDLAVVDGIETSKGGEGPWCPAVAPVAPGVVLAGRNAVTVDTVMAAVMGYDPLAGAGEHPWRGYNHLELLARAGVGTNDPGRIEVRGVAIREALFRFAPGTRGWVGLEEAEPGRPAAAGARGGRD